MFMICNVCDREMDVKRDDGSITRKFLNSNVFSYQFVHIVYTMHEYE